MILKIMSLRTTNVITCKRLRYRSIQAKIILKINWSKVHGSCLLQVMPGSWCATKFLADTKINDYWNHHYMQVWGTCIWSVICMVKKWEKKWDQLQHWWMPPKTVLVLHWVHYRVSIYSNIIMMYISESQIHEAERFEWLTKEHLCVLVYLVRMQLKQSTVWYSLELCLLNLKRRVSL